MDFDQLITFLEVARQGSFSRAGEKVFRSQSAVSAQIRQLEQEYGDRLLDRSGKTVKLTPAGQILFDYAERLKLLREESLMAVADHSSTPRGTLRVGANEATCLYVLPEVFAAGADQYLPEFQLQDHRKARERLHRSWHSDPTHSVSEPGNPTDLPRQADVDGEPQQSPGQA
jgi:DNA-binding transcriptional LysR family regulator